MAYQATTTNPIANYWLNGRLVTPNDPSQQQQIQQTPTPAPAPAPGVASQGAAPPQNYWDSTGFHIPDLPAQQFTGGQRRPPGTLVSGNVVAGAAQGPAPKTFESGLKQAGFGQDGEDPSLYATIKNGGASDGGLGHIAHPKAGGLDQWAQQGGPSLSAQLAPKLKHGSAFDPLGLTHDFNPKRTDATDKWGTPQANAADAGKYDWASYGNATDLKNAYDSTINDTSKQGQKNLHFETASNDTDGDGKLSLGEFVQWWATNTPDGQAAMMRGDIKPTQPALPPGLTGGKTPTFADLQAARAAQQGGAPSGNPILGAISSAQQPSATPSAAMPDTSSIDPELLKRLLSGYGSPT